MKITMLGTAALGYPLAFCNCDNCVRAREVKGKSIRKCASVLVNDDLIIDLGPDTQSSFFACDKDMGKVKYLLQTHIHADHYFEQSLITRIPYMDMKNQHLLSIYAQSNCMKIMSDRIRNYEDADLITDEGKNKLSVSTYCVEHGDLFEFGDYKVKAIDTDHDVKHGSLLYLVMNNGKNFLYATDTKPFTEDALKELDGYRLDLLVMDHTFGDVDYSFSHLNEKLFIEQINILKDKGIIDDNTIIYGTHISHCGNGIHEECEERAVKNGYHIAYDGMEINL